MPNIKVAVTHKLGAEEAKKRVTRLMSETRAKFGGNVTDLNEEWQENVDTFSFRAMGFAVEGRLEVQPAEVSVNLTVPFAALMFKSRIESEIRQHAEELLA